MATHDKTCGPSSSTSAPTPPLPTTSDVRRRRQSGGSSQGGLCHVIRPGPPWLGPRPARLRTCDSTGYRPSRACPTSAVRRPPGPKVVRQMPLRGGLHPGVGQPDALRWRAHVGDHPRRRVEIDLQVRLRRCFGFPGRPAWKSRTRRQKAETSARGGRANSSSIISRYSVSKSTIPAARPIPAADHRQWEELPLSGSLAQNRFHTTPTRRPEETHR